MEKLRIILVLLILSAVIPGCGVDTCRNEAYFSLDGIVEDSEGEQVSGVRIYGYADPPEGTRPQPSCSTRTDAAGRYSLPFTCNVEEFVVIPTREGCVFSPASRFWRHKDSLEGYDFEVYCGQGHLVDGYVWGREGPGQPFSGVRMSIQSSDGSRRDLTVTDEDGYYVFHDLYPVFHYEIVPYGYCPEYEPPSRTFEYPAKAYHDQDFTVVTPEFVYIRGCVRDPYENPIEGVTVSFTYIVPYGQHRNTASLPQAATQFEVETDQDGYYQIHTMTCMYISVRPNRLGCNAVPHMRGYGPRHDFNDQDYTLFCGEGYTISGYLKDDDAEPIAHADVIIRSLDFGRYEVETDLTGYYEFLNLPWGLDYEVRPGHCSGYLPSCICDPPQREYEDLDCDYTDQDFIRSCTH